MNNTKRHKEDCLNQNYLCKGCDCECHLITFTKPEIKDKARLRLIKLILEDKDLTFVVDITDSGGSLNG